jgi:hypothetical protein
LVRNAAREKLARHRRTLVVMSSEEDPRPLAQSLLASIGYTGSFALNPIAGGRNNRVWRLRTADGQFLFKRYYWSENDQRDRMGHEWSFLKYLHGNGSESAPEPIAADFTSRSALLEFIEGTALTLSSVTQYEVNFAIAFFMSMNSQRNSDTGRALPPASEACFSLNEHLATANRRVARLDQIVNDSEIGIAAKNFATDTIVPLWRELRARIESQPNLNDALRIEERCLSPSDFGFHNSIRPPSGPLRFVDFEYAGWDDPAKTIADFANQPDMLLPDALSDSFREIVEISFPSVAERLPLLVPLYQIKWACICLNEFLPAGSARRAFTGLSADEGLTRLAGHLDRARTMAARAAKSLDFPLS